MLYVPCRIFFFFKIIASDNPTLSCSLWLHSTFQRHLPDVCALKAFGTGYNVIQAPLLVECFYKFRVTVKTKSFFVLFYALCFSLGLYMSSPIGRNTHAQRTLWAHFWECVDVCALLLFTIRVTYCLTFTLLSFLR